MICYALPFPAHMLLHGASFTEPNISALDPYELALFTTGKDLAILDMEQGGNGFLETRYSPYAEVIVDAGASSERHELLELHRWQNCLDICLADRRISH